MKDLVCVVADKQIKATIEELLRRPLSLGIRPIEAQLLLHPHHDPGCYARPADLLRGYRKTAEHGLIVLDHAWDGVPVASGAELEALIAEKLDQAGYGGLGCPRRHRARTGGVGLQHLALRPGRAQAGRDRGPPSRKALEERNLWTAADAKPADPKAAIEYVLGRTGKSRSASLFRRLARKVNTAGCQDRAFLRLKTLLQTWFPPIASTDVGGQPTLSTLDGSQPNGPPRGRTHNVAHETRTRKKLIEVALPLDDINAASAREKSIRHGHPSTLHLWWARRPLAAARAVIFAQLVDDPSAHPELYSDREGPGAGAQAVCSASSASSSSGRTRPTKSCWNRRGRRSGSAGTGRAPTTRHIRGRRSCSIPTGWPAFHDPFAGGGALPLGSTEARTRSIR